MACWERSDFNLVIGKGFQQVLVGGLEADELGPRVDDDPLGHSVLQSQELQPLNHGDGLAVVNDVEADGPRYDVRR